MLLLGAGPRALLLQIAHPLVAVGVADHSDFRADPWRRLDGTLRSYLRIIYGSTASARDEFRRLAKVHRRVVGAGYSARDPELALWVHGTLVDATLTTYSAWIEPVDRAAAARFYDETLPIGRAVGIPASMLPPDLTAFERYLDDQLTPGGPIRPGPVARELAQVILHPPLPGVLARLGVPTVAYDWVLWPAVGLLPTAVREGYGLPWGIRERAVAAWLVAGWRAWRPLVPPVLRHMPQARAADRRIVRGLSGSRGTAR